VGGVEVGAVVGAAGVFGCDVVGGVGAGVAAYVADAVFFGDDLG
jgi:hypothetical protein